MTKLPAIRDRSVVRSSVIPSAKYSCSGSLLRFANGRTTIDRRGASLVSILAGGEFAVGGAWAVVAGGFSRGHAHHPPAPSAAAPRMIDAPMTAWVLIRRRLDRVCDAVK